MTYIQNMVVLLDLNEIGDNICELVERVDGFRVCDDDLTNRRQSDTGTET